MGKNSEIVALICRYTETVPKWSCTEIIYTDMDIYWSGPNPLLEVRG